MTHDFSHLELPSANLEARLLRHFHGPVHVVVAGDTHSPLVQTRAGC